MNQVEDPYGRRISLINVTAKTADVQNLDPSDWSCFSKAEKMHVLERLTKALNISRDWDQELEKSEEAPSITAGGNRETEGSAFWYKNLIGFAILHNRSGSRCGSALDELYGNRIDRSGGNRNGEGEHSDNGLELHLGWMMNVLEDLVWEVR